MRMMKNSKKRLWSVLMTFVMVVSLFVGVGSMEAKAEEKTQITAMTLNVNWSKIPSLTVGEAFPEMSEAPAIAGGTGVIEGAVPVCGWCVKATQAHVDAGYLRQDAYEHFTTNYGGWVNLRAYSPDYKVNATDTYACWVGVEAQPGYGFAGEPGGDISNMITSNVSVEKAFLDGGDSRVVAFLKLGTLEEIADKKEEAGDDYTIKAMTLNVDWDKIPSLKVGEAFPEMSEAPAIAGGTGVIEGPVLDYGWCVKATQAHVDAGYLDQNSYDFYTESYGGWANLIDYSSDYKVNATDTYACWVTAWAQSGYGFAGKPGVDISNMITSNVSVEKAFLNGGYSGVVAFLKLGTLEEIQKEKGEESHTCEFGTAWKYDAEKHWHECSCGAKADSAAHTINNWVITKEATATTEGEMKGSCRVCGYTATKSIPVTSGDIKVEVPDTNDHKGQLTNEADVKGKVSLTEAERAAINSGSDLTIILKMNDMDVSVNTTEKEAINEKLGNNKLGTFLDIELIKKVGSNEVKVSETTGLIEITLEVPMNLRNTDSNITRTYKIMRNHDGVVDILDAVYDPATGKLTFETDRFSTYALVYSDAAATDVIAASGTSAASDASAAANPQAESPKTGDDSHVSLWVFLLAVACSMVVVIGRKKKESI